jgi:hypothetical protein
MLDRELGVEPSFEIDDVLGEFFRKRLGGSSMADVG